MKALQLFDSSFFNSVKNSRFEAKLNDKFKEFLQEAANLQGSDLSTFVLTAAAEKARKIVSEAEAIILTEKEHQAFKEILKNPPKATQELKELMALDRLNER